MSAAPTSELTALPRSPTLPTFFDNLDSFAEGPEGVAKLRAFVLDLAVRGKLVEQDESDELANIECRELDGQGNSPPFALPLNWLWSSLLDAAEEVVDCPHSTPKWTECGKICVRTTELNPGVLDLSAARYVSDETYQKRIRRLEPKADDILYCREGQVGNACRVPPNVELCMGQRMMLIRPAPSVSASYLERVLNSPLTKNRVAGLLTGMTALRVNVKTVKDYWVPVPPLSEQCRIVSKVDGLMSLCDELESRGSERVRLRERASRSCLDRLVVSSSANDLSSAWQRLSDHFEVLYDTPETLDGLRQAILAMASYGKLTIDWREVHPETPHASHLLEIADETNLSSKKRAGRLWGSGRVPELTDEERDHLPDNWVWTKVRDLGFTPDDAVQVGPMSMKSREFTLAGVPVLNVGCVKWDYFQESKLNFLPPDKAKQVDRYRIAQGDIVFTRSGTIGRCAIAGERQHGYLMTFHLLRARPNPKKCLPQYLHIVFRGAPHVLRQMDDAAIGTTRAGFNTKLLENLDVPLPPLAEQKRIVAKVDQLLSQCDELSARLRERQSATQQLLTANIHDILNGKIHG